MAIRRDDTRRWYQSPLYDYLEARKKLTVNVTGSSWEIGGLKRSQAVEQALLEFKDVGGNKVLDFGAGSWLRYVETICQTLPDVDLHVVEFDQAFHDDSTAKKETLSLNVSFYSPASFIKKENKYDLVLLINVLNTIPEEEHRRQVFDHLSRRLNPLGWLLVYQRIWDTTDKPEEKLPYGEGWLVPQKRYDYYTYRAKTGAIWFNLRAESCGLKLVRIKTRITSKNTLLKVWEKPFLGKRKRS